MNNIVVKLKSKKDMERFCLKENLSVLYNLKSYLDDLYYNDKSVLDDTLYDILKDYLMKSDPDYIPIVGSKIRDKDKRIKLPVWLGSLDKLTPPEQKGLDRFIIKNDSPFYIITEKLDGVSGLLYIKNGKQNLYTRGDGFVGSDISHLIKYLNIPKIKDDIIIRGEIVIKTKNFLKYNEYYKNPRNMVSGLVSSKTVREGLKDLTFISYEIIGNDIMDSPLTQLNKLKSMGFKVVKSLKVTKNQTSNTEKLQKIHDLFKLKTHYLIDGIVVQSNLKYDRNIDGNPKYSFAYKVIDSSNIARTRVIDIEWSITQWKYIIPIAIIEPVELSGAKISRISLGSARLMKQKMIGVNSIVNVTRSKDVIPFILNVVKKCEILKMPTIEYKWDSNNVHIVAINIDNDTKDIIHIKYLVKFFSKMKIKYLALSTVKKLYNNGFNTLVKIFDATKKELLQIEGIKEKSAERIITNIKNGLTNITIPQILGSAGIFGYSIGVKRIESLMLDIPDLVSENKDINIIKQNILKVEGFSEKITKKIIENIPNAKTFLKSVEPYVTYINSTRISNSLVGYKYVMSGFRDIELEKNIKNMGGKIVSSVSKNTKYLIVKSKNSGSGKEKKAKSLGIEILTKEEFQHSIKNM